MFSYRKLIESHKLLYSDTGEGTEKEDSLQQSQITSLVECDRYITGHSDMEMMSQILN